MLLMGDTRVHSLTLVSCMSRFIIQRERGLWGALCLEASKEDLIKRRNESVERSHKRLEEGRQIRLQRKAQEVK